MIRKNLNKSIFAGPKTSRNLALLSDHVKKKKAKNNKQK
jgi:hypothetical protein